MCTIQDKEVTSVCDESKESCKSIRSLREGSGDEVEALVSDVEVYGAIAGRAARLRFAFRVFAMHFQERQHGGHEEEERKRMRSLTSAQSQS